MSCGVVQSDHGFPEKILGKSYTVYIEWYVLCDVLYNAHAYTIYSIYIQKSLLGAAGKKNSIQHFARKSCVPS